MTGATAGEKPCGLTRELAHSGTAAIADEPLWAIGSGHVPAPDQITEMHRHFRTCLLALAGAAGTGIRILYGGSVTAANASEALGRTTWAGYSSAARAYVPRTFDAVLGCVPERQLAPA